MFSGIVATVGRVVSLSEAGSGRHISIETHFDDLELGESVAVDGVCLTVTAVSASTVMEVFASSETLARTNLGRAGVGAAVNLERAATLQTRLSGHLVQGHVDGVGRFADIAQDDEAYRLLVALPARLRRYCVEKGSIALSGVSLTLNTLGEPLADGAFLAGLTIIPHTWSHTNLQSAAIGDAVNVEVDVLAKYVEQLCHGYLKPSTV